MSPYAFRHCRTEWLSICNGRLITAPAITPVSSTIQFVTFMGHRIASIPDDYFINCTKLVSVSFARNMLSRIPDLTPIVQTLASIIMDDNRLNDVSMLTTTMFTVLKTLHLQNNRITSFTFHPNTFPSLLFLNIRNNRLSQLADFFPSPQGITGYHNSTTTPQVILANNPWDCSKPLVWSLHSSNKDEDFENKADHCNYNPFSTRYWYDIHGWTVYVCRMYRVLCHSPRNMVNCSIIEIGKCCVTTG